MNGKEELPAHYEKFFSDFFFVRPMNKNETVLTAGDAGNRYTCNMDHRLSRFMIENAELLHSRVKGIFYEMIRILRKFRFEVLEIIHEKQQSLDSLDYLIYKIREGTFDK